MEIVYCGDCGRSLRRDDFAQAKAHYINDVPYCSECRPVEAPRSTTSGTVRKLSTTRMPRTAVPPTARAAPRREASRMPLMIGGAFAGISLVALLVVVLSGGRSGEIPAPARGPVPRPDRPAAGPAPRDREAEEARLREEERNREIRRRRQEEERRRSEEARVDSLLARAREMSREDPRFERRADVVGVLKDALEAAGSGPRRVEVERALAEYEKAMEDSRRMTLAGLKGPYDLDPSGFIQNWLILGPFPNPEDKCFYVDYLKTEEDHQPAEGKSVPRDGGAVKWGQYFAEGGRVNFFQVPHLGLSDRQQFIVEYAACRLECDRDSDVEIRLGSDDGFRLWLDGEVRLGRHVHRGVKEDEDVLQVRLTKGVHLLLLKVDQGDGDHGFVVRVVTPQGVRPAGIRIWN